MNKRWQANRMGFVNFWLYDEEEFFFDKGRLLLRGENASGKSITTQSMIPFILDGDRSPQRLDPFGSRDRKMEYYLLGDHEREEATGYIYLEFKKQGLDQYCTIGIGQRAQQGKPITFWGFVILDHRRIGKDLWLYRQTGGKNIPKTKQELKNDLGDQNVFVDKQKEYMEAVNKHIFGFPRVDLYEQFIRLLIKVRAPKLSKDLKPSLVYDILNESLQTLSDDDIRLLVDAMEQLDTIQATIDGLKNTMKDVKAVRNEYNRYNQFMLGKKAQVYHEHHQSYVKMCTSLTEKQQTVKSNEHVQQEITGQLQKDQDRIAALEQERKLVNDQDIHDAYEQLEATQQEHKNNQAEKQKQENKLEIIDNRIMDNRVDLEAVIDQINNLRYEMEKSREDIEALCAELDFPYHLSYHEGEQGIIGQLKQANETLKQFKKELGEARDVLISYEQENQHYSILSEALNELSRAKGQLQNQLNEARKMVVAEKDRLIEMLYIQKQDNRYLQWEEPIFLRIQQLFRTYEGAQQKDEIWTIYRELYDHQQSSRRTAKLKLEFDKDQCQETIKTIETELEAIRNQKEPVLPHKDKVAQTRELLQKKGIRFLPFYQAIEYADGLSEEKQNLLETQLSDCGVLDALIIAGEDMPRIKQEWDVLSDVILNPVNASEKAYPYLTAGIIEPAFQSQVNRVLCSIGLDSAQTCDIILADDGYFRHGLLEGHSIADEPACFIGVAARERKKQQMIMEKEQELARAQEQLESIMRNLKEVNDGLAGLKQEYQKLPGFDDLDATLRIEQETAVLWERKQKEYAEKEAEANQSSAKCTQLRQEVIERCRKFNFERSAERYEQALDDCEDLKEYFDEYRNHCDGVMNKLEVKNTYSKAAEELEQRKSDVTSNLATINRNLNKAETAIQQLQQFLNLPENVDVMQHLERIKTELEQLNVKVNKNEKSLMALDVEQRQLIKEIDDLRETIQADKQIDEELLAIYEEELNLEYVIQRENRTSIECLQEAIASMKSQDKDRSAIDVTASLTKNFQQHSSNLFAYGAVLDDLFEDHRDYLRRRSVIRLEWNGQKLNLEQFYQVLKSSIDENELMIQEKDRKIFEDILSGTVSQKLSNRISDSRKWIDAMSDMMWSMDTSMGLNFKLRWKAKSPENDQELSIEELEKLLNRDKVLLTREDMAKVSAHFRSKIQTAKHLAEDRGDIFNYGDLIRDALDYRKWFEFHMYFAHAGEATKELTNSAFNKFSGGEKAMAMYVPLFAAVNAQYKKCERAEHPRIIALDEAFAGVDDKNISVMFDLVEKLDFDYIMNSQALWGCYGEVSSLRIAELSRPVNSQVVTVINYRWNGQRREVVE